VKLEKFASDGLQDKLIDMHSVQLFRTSINFVFELKYNFRAQVQAGQAPNEFAQSLSHMRLGLLNGTALCC